MSIGLKTNVFLIKIKLFLEQKKIFPENHTTNRTDEHFVFFFFFFLPLRFINIFSRHFFFFFFAPSIYKYFFETKNVGKNVAFYKLYTTQFPSIKIGLVTCILRCTHLHTFLFFIVILFAFKQFKTV